NAGIELAQRVFDQPPEERRGAGHERWNGAFHTQRRAGQYPGERNHDNQKNEEGDGAQHVHHEGQHLIHRRIGQHLARAREKQNDAQWQADQNREQKREARHQQCVDGGFADQQPVNIAEVHWCNSSQTTPSARSTSGRRRHESAGPSTATTSCPYGVSLIRPTDPCRMLRSTPRSRLTRLNRGCSVESPLKLRRSSVPCMPCATSRQPSASRPLSESSDCVTAC